MFYPLFIDLDERKALVVGGGKVGTRRARYLHAAGADVSVISSEFSDELKGLDVEFIKGSVKDGLINYPDYFIVVVATDNKDVNEEVSRQARQSGVLVCLADDHTKGDVIFPMTTKVAGHMLAITTLGEDPKKLKRIKELIEDEFAPQ